MPLISFLLTMQFPPRTRDGLAYAAFPLLATLGYGAHHAFDLVVASPSTLACQAPCLQPAAAAGPAGGPWRPARR